MPVFVGNSTVNTSIASGNVTVNVPQGYAEYNATRNTVMPTLRLDFVNSNVLDPRITFTRASSATYFNSAGVLTTAASNIPRFDYNPATSVCNGLLIEQASVNLLLQSNFASSWGTNGSPTITLNAATSPDGTTNAVLWTRTLTSSTHIYQTTSKAASALTYSFSVFVKPSVGNYVALRMQGSYPGRADVVFNLSSGTISTAAVATSAFTGASATIQALSNGWYRVSLTATTDTNTIMQDFISFNSNGGLIDGTDSVSNSAGYIYGAQLEQLAFATSYITTTGATASRVVDQTSLTGTNFSSWYNTTNWTTVISAIPANIPNTSGTTELLFQFTIDGSNRILARIGSTASVLTSYWINNISQPQNAGGYNSSSLTANTLFKYGITASNGSWNLALNGTIFNSTAGYLITPTSLSIGYSSNDLNGFNGWIQRVAYYPVVVSNNELISLTS